MTQSFRLSPEAYKELEKQLPPPTINNDTSELMAGFRLGVQAVLKLLREGYVVQDNSPS